MPHQHWTVNYMFIARGWVPISLQGEYWQILPLGTGLENLGSRDRIGQYYSASRDGHQIHPRRVIRIGSVKINPSLVMMREWILFCHANANYSSGQSDTCVVVLLASQTLHWALASSHYKVTVTLVILCKKPTPYCELNQIQRFLSCNSEMTK